MVRTMASHHMWIEFVVKYFLAQRVLPQDLQFSSLNKSNFYLNLSLNLILWTWMLYTMFAWCKQLMQWKLQATIKSKNHTIKVDHKKSKLKIVRYYCIALTKFVSGSNTAMVKSRSKYSRNSLTNPVTRRPDEARSWKEQENVKTHDMYFQY